MYINYILLFYLVTGSAAGRDYSGYKVLRTTPQDSSSHNFLRSLENQYDFWKESRGVGHSADILVSGEEHPVLVSKLNETGCDVMTMIEDLQPLIEDQRKMKMTRSSEFDYNRYHSFDEINDWINDFTAENSNIVAKEKLFETYEGRDVYKLRISSDLADKNKPIFFMIGGSHAREWISPATMMYVANLLLSKDNAISTMEWNIVPVLNPDGYAYSWMHDRLWKKTRYPNEGSHCLGTDLNRNYDIHWGESMSSSNPCSEVYHGLSPNSSVEVRSVQDHVFSIKDRVKVFLDVQAYGQHWMYPYGYTDSPPVGFPLLKKISRRAVRRIQSVNGKKYDVRKLAYLGFLVSWTSTDWAFDVAGIEYSFCVDLRDTGSWGFVSPPSQIKPTAEEFFAGCRAVSLFFSRHLFS